MAITPLPPAPDRATPATFANLGDALLSALPTFVTEANALQVDVNAQQVSATTQVTLATTQATNAASSTAVIWVSGTTYAIGNVRFSPVNFQNYRRKTAGAGTTDPSTDTTNWGILATIPTVIGDASKFLQSNGTTLAWADPIPSQTGNAGKFLTTNGTAASFGALPSSGGTTITGSVTLTVSSAGSMTVTPASHGLYVTLPSATTCGKSAIVFSIFNAGHYDYGIKDSTGKQLGWVLSGSNSIIGLSDNATAAGVWNISNLCKIGVTARKDLTLLGVDVKQHIALDSTRSLFIFTANSLFYGIIYNASTITWGSSTLIRNAVVAYSQSLLIAADKVLVISYVNASTAMETVVLSTSGTTITVNTAVATTLAGNFVYSANLITVGTSFVAVYARATSITGLRAITVSGTVPTVGAEVADAYKGGVIFTVICIRFSC